MQISGGNGVYNTRIIEDKSERQRLIDFIVEHKLKRIETSTRNDFFKHYPYKACPHTYYYVYYTICNDINIESSPWCWIYCEEFDKYHNLIVPLNEDCISTDEMKSWSDNQTLFNANRELKSAISKVEKQFSVKISQDKQTSRNNGINTSGQILLWKNEKYDGCEVEHVTGIDATSAYTSYLVNHLIDFCTIPDVNYAGQEAAINAAINAELRQYSLEWFNKKKAATTPEEKKKAKRMLNVIIGMIRNSNVWAWKQIVGGVKEYMLSLKGLVEADGCECLYCNTDSIYYTGNTKVFDSLAGENLGNFHAEHKDCRFRWRKGVMAYQINDESPVWRGVSGERYELYERINGRPYNILTDELPNLKLLGRIF